MNPPPPPSRPVAPSDPPPPRLVRQPSGILLGLKRGMVFSVMMPQSQAQGSETRHDVPSPWVVVSTDRLHARLPLVHAVPFTSKLDKAAAAFRVQVTLAEITRYQSANPLRVQDQLVLAEQLRALDQGRLAEAPIAQVKEAAILRVEAALRHILSM